MVQMGKKILLVDDELVIPDILKRRFERMGFVVINRSQWLSRHQDNQDHPYRPGCLRY